jgi:hypothetical protein
VINKPVKFTTPLDEKAVQLEDYLASISRDALRSASGTYVGDGKASRTVDFGFSPKLVIIQRFLDYAREAPTVFTPTLSASSNLVWDKVITGSAVSSVTTNGEVVLDAVAHGNYRYQFEIYNTSGGICGGWRIYINNDTTAGHYSYNTGGASAGNSYFQYNSIANNYPVFCNGVIGVNPVISGGQFYMNGNFLYTGASAQYVTGVWSVPASFTPSNITRIDIQSDTANSIGVGSRFRLWRMTNPTPTFTANTVTNNMVFATADNPGVSYIPSYGYVTDGVKSFTSTGITVGSNTNVNAETKTFTYFAVG